jgi:hypothetical protein
MAMILGKIQKILSQIKNGVINNQDEQKIGDLTTEYYQTLPFDFGAKIPPKINHVLIVKEKLRWVEWLNNICVL